MSNKIFKLIEQEKKRQISGLVMIPSENYVSANVLRALGSVLVNKYSEGYPGARYYSGNKIIDEVENYTKDLANKLFGTVHANVQPYSGSPANFAVDWAVAGKDGVILGLDLPSGGHLTHGAKASATSVFYQAINYHVDETGKVDFDEVEQLCKEHKPKLIWMGGTAYRYQLEFEKFAEIADSIGAYLAADISHVAGLIVGGVHPNPVKYVHIITSTTHKTLRGPRGAMILITQKGLDKDPELAQKIDKAVFPGLQGGPHENQIAALAVTLEEAATPKFKNYAHQIIKNAATLAEELGTNTENHLLLWNLEQYGYGMGYQAHIALEEANIFVNKNTVPHEPASPFYPSGIRLGTPALTSRGMKEKEMVKIASWIKQALEEIKGYDLPRQQEERRGFIKSFRKKMAQNTKLKKIKQEVENFAQKYPVPGIKKL